MNRRTKAYFYLICATAIWGTASPIIKFTLGGLDPIIFLFYRFLVSGAVALIILFILRPKLPRSLKTWSEIIIYGTLATTIAIGFLFLGLDRTTVLELGIISAISPLLIILGGGMFLREKVTKREKKGIILALTGTAITIFTPIILGQNNFKFSGNLLILMFLFSDATSILLAKRMMKNKKIAPLVIANLAFIIGITTLTPFIISSVGIDQVFGTLATLPFKYHLGVWYMALASGSLAYYFFIRGTRTIEAGEASMFFYLQPIFTIPLAILWLKESVSLPYIVGAIIIATGVYVAETRRN